MVRLSVIVLGLLAAAWCSTGAAEDWQVRKFQGYTQLSCGSGQVMAYLNHFSPKGCSGPSFTRNTAECISSSTFLYLFKNCNLKKSCKVKDPIKKGPHGGQYGCRKASRYF